MALKAGLEKRVAALEARKIYRVSTLADLVILAAWRQRGDPRAPRPEEVVWDPVFAEIYDRRTKRGSEKK